MTRYQQFEAELARRKEEFGQELYVLDENYGDELEMMLYSLIPDFQEAVRCCRESQRIMKHRSDTCNCDACSLLRRLDREVTP